MQSVFFVALRWAPRPFGGARAKKKKHHPGCFVLLRPRGKAGEGEAPCRHGARAKKNTTQGAFFFAAAPAKGKGRRSPVGRRHGARAKKKHRPGCFFFAPAPGKGRGRRSPVPTRGQSKKKNTTQGVFFLLRPRRKAREGEAPLGAGTGPEQKKKTPPRVFFFAPAPGKGRGRRSPVGRRHGTIFFLLWPRAGAQRGFSFPCLSPGPEQKKKHPGWCCFCSGPVPAPNGASPSLPFAGAAAKKKNTLGGVFFLLWPRAGTGLLLPCLSPGPEQKKKHPGWCFFLAAAPRGRSLTHCGPGWRCLPLAGVVFSFCCGPARTGVVFFFLLWPRPDAHSLTVGWGDFGKARVVFFFLLRPRRVFLDNRKKMSGVLHRV